MEMAAVWEADVLRLINSGKLDQAADLLDRHLSADPSDVGALRQHGRIMLALGRPSAATDLFHRAAALAPASSDIFFELGVSQLAGKDFAGAAESFRAVLRADPAHADSCFNLGWALRSLGDSEAAIEPLRQAASLRPHWPAAWYNLGNSLTELGRLEAAEEAFQRALEQAPDAADASANLGVVLWRQGKVELAEKQLRAALAATPAPMAAVTGLGALLLGTGRGDEAVSLMQSHLQTRPDNGDLLTSLGAALSALGRRAEAVTILKRAIAVAPGLADAWNALGAVLLAQENLTEAEGAFAEALRLNPGFAEAANNLGNLAASRGDADKALAFYRQAHDMAPANPEIHSNLLFLQVHRKAFDDNEVFAEHCRYGQIQESLAIVVPLPPPDTGRKLRLGYVSPDFCDHAVTFWFEGVLASHDRETFDIYCYHSGVRVDAVTERLRGYGDTWRFIGGLPADAAARIVRMDDIDILVDLAGHSARNALPVFARKPARIQATWLGYPFTTGLSRVDYRITNESSDPEGIADALYTERLVRIDMAPVFRPPYHAPPCDAPPFLKRGRVRFGSFNKPQKITPAVMDTWAGIMTRVPDSDLLMILPGGDDPSVQEEARSHYTARGIAPERIEIIGLRDLAGFLAAVREVDIALDPFPYGGGTTTMLTLWMGVPIICLDGIGSAAGVSCGMLGLVGLHDLRAASPDHYIAIAAQLAASRDTLVTLRTELRERIRQSTIMQERQFTSSVEQEYGKWWRRFLEETPCAP